MSDSVNHPAHYNQGGIECIAALESAVAHLTGVEAFATASAIKYLWRWKQKGGHEDLRKARWYIEHLLPREPESTRALGSDHLRQLKGEWRQRIVAAFTERSLTGPATHELLDHILEEVFR